MGKSQRAMGQAAELDARDRLQVLWAACRRGLGQATGAAEADLEKTPIRWEAKSWKTWPSVEDALATLKRDAEKYGDVRPRAVIHKRKRTKKGKPSTDWRVTFELDEFVRFVEGMRR